MTCWTDLPFMNSVKPELVIIFLQSLASDIESLGLFAGIHPKSYWGLYRTSSKRFPFSIYYRFDGATAIVAAIVDARRNPRTIRKVLSGRTGTS
jgi:hypothetical protein